MKEKKSGWVLSWEGDIDEDKSKWTEASKFGCRICHIKVPYGIGTYYWGACPECAKAAINTASSITGEGD